MYVHTQIYIYIYIYTHTHTYMYMFTYTYIYPIELATENSRPRMPKTYQAKSQIILYAMKSEPQYNSINDTIRNLMSETMKTIIIHAYMYMYIHLYVYI